jgi:uncharacterized protein
MDLSHSRNDNVPLATASMKLTREDSSYVNLIRSYSAQEIRVGEHVLRSSCLFSADSLIADWPPQTIADLVADHFAAALAWKPEIVLLGTGARQEFPAREVYAAILSRGIGFEVMDTGAACRTFNVLVGESRRVAAGILIATDNRG